MSAGRVLGTVVVAFALLLVGVARRRGGTAPLNPQPEPPGLNPQPEPPG